MIKTLRYLLATLTLLLTTNAYGQQSYLGYCPEELDEQAASVQLAGYTINFQAAIVLPAARMAAYKDAEITRIRFYAPAGLTAVYAWLRKSLTSSAISGTLTRVGTTSEGWNEVTLSTPYVVTGEDLVIGYSGSCAPNLGLIVDGEVEANKSFVNLGNSGWIDLGTQNIPQLCLQAVVMKDNAEDFIDAAVSKCSLSKQFYQTGENASAEVALSNYGNADYPTPKLYYSVNAGTPVAVPTEGTIEKGKSVSYSLSIPTESCVSGRNALKIWIETEDQVKSNDTLTTTLNCYETAFPRKVLVENFTTLRCPNCPNGHSVLAKLLEGRNDYIWVAHHVGYYTDELTVSESSSYLSPFGVSGAPSATFDRSLTSASENGALAFGIGYTQIATGANILKPAFEACAEKPAFASVDIDNSYNDETRELTVTVRGQKNNAFDTYYDAANLTVYLLEDGVTTSAAQSGDANAATNKIHSHVLRAILTDTWGDAVEWNEDGTYSRTFTYTIPEHWKGQQNYDPAPGRMQVAAFLSRPNKGNSTLLEVLNANKTAFNKSTTGLDGTTMEGTKVISHEYYDLNGRRIAAPAQGVYIEKTVTDKGTTISKRLK